MAIVEVAKSDSAECLSFSRGPLIKTRQVIPKLKRFPGGKKLLIPWNFRLRYVIGFRPGDRERLSYFIWKISLGARDSLPCDSARKACLTAKTERYRLVVPCRNCPCVINIYIFFGKVSGLAGRHTRPHTERRN